MQAAYRLYWWRALTHPDSRAAEEMRLLQTLRQLLGPAALGQAPDALDPMVAERLGGAGLHVLQGRTPPLLELMLWSSEEEKRFTVALPEGSHATRVLVLDGFHSLGWAEWATCGRYATAGWAGTTLDGDDFRIESSNNCGMWSSSTGWSSRCAASRLRVRGPRCDDQEREAADRPALQASDGITRWRDVA